MASTDFQLLHDLNNFVWRRVFDLLSLYALLKIMQ